MTDRLLTTLREFARIFTVHSESVMFDESLQKQTMQQIYDANCTSNGPVSMIAVTRHQYDVTEFPKYVEYIKNTLQISTIYYGLWTGGGKVEYDLLYVVPTDDYEIIQKHLNAHNFLNDSISQRMALVICSDGSTKIIENSS
jgi:hypothetical protein